MTGSGTKQKRTCLSGDVFLDASTKTCWFTGQPLLEGTLRSMPLYGSQRFFMSPRSSGASVKTFCYGIFPGRLPSYFDDLVRPPGHW
jgi:hypothetical protein